MIQGIIEGISSAIYEEFGGEFTIYSEEVKQGLKEPCFIISCVRTGRKAEMRRAYTQNNLFWVQYIPKENGRKKAECYSAAERLERCLEYITVGGDLVRGVGIHYEVNEGVLTFSVTYKMRFIEQRGRSEPEMEALQKTVNLKG